MRSSDCAKADERVEDIEQCVTSPMFQRIALAAERELRGAGAAEGPAGGSGFQGLRDQGWTTLQQGNRCSMLECGSCFRDDAERTYC